jgi:hypothetical protein
MSPETPAIYVQVSSVSSPGNKPTRGPREKLAELTQAQMDQAFTVAESVAARTARMLTHLQAQEDQDQLSGAELSFGLSFSSDLKAYIVNASTAATLQIKLTWNANKE